MQVILLENVRNLGQLGEMVSVRPGYGRNYLIPQGKAVAATEENQKKFETLRAELERKAEEARADALGRAEKLQALLVTIHARAGEEGKLFGSVGAQDIAQAIRDSGVAVEKQEIRLPNGPLRSTGEHEVLVHLHSDIDARVTVSVIAEE